MSDGDVEAVEEYPHGRQQYLVVNNFCINNINESFDKDILLPLSPSLSHCVSSTSLCATEGHAIK